MTSLVPVETSVVESAPKSPAIFASYNVSVWLTTVPNGPYEEVACALACVVAALVVVFWTLESGESSGLTMFSQVGVDVFSSDAI